MLTLGGFLFSKFKPCNAANIFNKRMITLWLMIALFAIALSFKSEIALAFFAIISFLALWEYFKMIKNKFPQIGESKWVYFVIPIQYTALYFGNLKLFYLFVPFIVFLAIPIIKILRGKNIDFIVNYTLLHVGLMFTVYSIGYLGAFLLISPSVGLNCIALITYILILTLMNDFMQTVFGQLFGQTKIVPNVSPNKTWVGLIGGTSSTICLSVLMGKYLTPFSVNQLLFCGFILGIAGFFGDVTISAIKRDIGVKDSGTMLPGHGGILDRFDSLFFTAPLFFHYVAYLNKIGLM